MKSAAVKEFWMDTDLLEKALDNCDLGDGYMAKVRQYPHKDHIQYYTHVIEHSALLEERARSEKLREAARKLATVSNGLSIYVRGNQPIATNEADIKERIARLYVLQCELEEALESYSKQTGSGE